MPEQRNSESTSSHQVGQRNASSNGTQAKANTNAWATPTTTTKAPQSRKSLQILNTILKKSNEEHDAQFEKWCNDMLEQACPEHTPPHEATQMTLESNKGIEKFPHDPWNLPFPPRAPFKGRSEIEAQLNTPKLMNFLAMPTTTTMLVKFKGDPKLAKMLRSFLSNELAINLETLHEAPIERFPPHHSPKATINKLTPIEDLVDHDPKYLFGLHMLSNYSKAMNPMHRSLLYAKETPFLGYAMEEQV